MPDNEAMPVVGVIRGATMSDIEQEVDAQWQALKSDPELREFAESQGIDLAAVDAMDAPPIVVDRKRSGTGVGEAILIGVAVNLATAATTALAKQIWQTVLKPALNKGARTLEDEEA